MKVTTKLASNNPVTFVAQKRFAVLFFLQSYCVNSLVFATGRQEEEDGRTLVCDKHDKPISNVFCLDLHLTSMFSGLLQEDLFKEK